MFVPISCGVSRGTQLEYAWFNLKKGGSAHLWSLCMLQYAWAAGVCLGLCPCGDEWGQGMVPASCGVERAWDAPGAMWNGVFYSSDKQEGEQFQLCLWTLETLLPFSTCIHFHLHPVSRKCCGTARLSPCTCVSGNVMLKPVENQISGV